MRMGGGLALHPRADGAKGARGVRGHVAGPPAGYGIGAQPPERVCARGGGLVQGRDCGGAGVGNSGRLAAGDERAQRDGLHRANVSPMSPAHRKCFQS
jgi:hypothetical protein